VIRDATAVQWGADEGARAEALYARKRGPARRFNETSPTVSRNQPDGFTKTCPTVSRRPARRFHEDLPDRRHPKSCSAASFGGFLKIQDSRARFFSKTRMYCAQAD
jgi:hypothetical protein